MHHAFLPLPNRRRSALEMVEWGLSSTAARLTGWHLARRHRGARRATREAGVGLCAVVGVRVPLEMHLTACLGNSRLGSRRAWLRGR